PLTAGGELAAPWRAGRALPRGAGGGASGLGWPGRRSSAGFQSGRAARPHWGLCGPRWPVASRGRPRARAPGFWRGGYAYFPSAGATRGLGHQRHRPGYVGAHGGPLARLGAVAAACAGARLCSTGAGRPARSGPRLVDGAALGLRGKLAGSALA
nr:hypothetical protein [Tanacetum cinerariifolium]